MVELKKGNPECLGDLSPHNLVVAIITSISFGIYRAAMQLKSCAQSLVYLTNPFAWAEWLFSLKTMNSMHFHVIHCLYKHQSQLST